MKIYTRKGDDGSTGLAGGKRIGKDEPRIEANGGVDELNAWIGLSATACQNAELNRMLRHIQIDLFDLGADLAQPAPDSDESAPAMRITLKQIQQLENEIDALEQYLTALKHFILPGGNELAARLHVARTVCRRVERSCIVLSRLETLDPHTVVYLNRLSDLLFVMARRANQLADVADVVWNGDE